MREMSPEEMKRRTKAIGVAAIQACAAMSRSTAARVVTDQLIRSATSIGANYRSARRGRSRKEFIAKLGIVVEEADETLYWLEVAIDAQLLPRQPTLPLWREVNEVLSIIIATINSSRPPPRQNET
jgi:four helix bundle protein